MEDGCQELMTKGGDRDGGGGLRGWGSGWGRVLAKGKAMQKFQMWR